MMSEIALLVLQPLLVRDVTGDAQVVDQVGARLRTLQYVGWIVFIITASSLLSPLMPKR